MSMEAFSLIFVTVFAIGTVINIMLRRRTDMSDFTLLERSVAALFVGVIYAVWLLARELLPEFQIILVFIAVLLFSFVSSAQRFISTIRSWLIRNED